MTFGAWGVRRGGNHGCVWAMRRFILLLLVGAVTIGMPSLVHAQFADCPAGSETLRLQNGRFEVELVWQTRDGAIGDGCAVAGTESRDSGLLWFFQPENWEFLVKVLNQCSNPNARGYWVFAAAATDVSYDLVVRDTRSGAVRSYSKQVGTQAVSITDNRAFPDACP